MKSNPKTTIILSLSVIAFLSALYLGYFIYMEEWSNFHVVSDKRLYRSAQMDTDELQSFLIKYKIKSILNLRGARKPNHSKWYDDEKNISRKLGIIHKDYRISAMKLLSPNKIEEILSIMTNMPEPILIHCQGGADRSGLISAVWKYRIEGKSAKESYKELNMRYFHLPFLGNKTKAMDKSFWDFVKK